MSKTAFPRNSSSTLPNKSDKSSPLQRPSDNARTPSENLVPSKASHPFASVVHGSRAPRLFGLDSLRALAVVLVVAYHFAPNVLPGGFIGVDMFFVLSGFLITSLLVQEFRRNGSVSLVHFWQRRARRILPALTLVVFVMTAVVGVFGGDLLVGLPAQLLGAFSFSSNWVYIATGADYEAVLTPALFNNLWSLAVEEQFYVVWPLVTVGLFVATSRLSRRRARALWTLVAYVAAGLSALAMFVLYAPDNSSRVYFGTDTHLFGLMLGAGLAFVLIPHPEQGWPTRLPLLARATQRLPQWVVRTGHGLLALGAVAVIGWSAVSLRFEQGAPFHGGLLAVSLATALLISVIVANQKAAKAIERPSIAWVGKRSYGLYLWHWPVLVVAAHTLSGRAAGQDATAVVLVVGLGITVACAALSYRLVELPVLHHGVRDSWRRCYRWLSGQLTVVTADPQLLSDDRSATPETDGSLGGAVSSGRAQSWLRLGAAATVVVIVVAGFTAALTRAPHTSSIEDSIDHGAALLESAAKNPSSPPAIGSASETVADHALRRATGRISVYRENAPVFVPTVPAGDRVTIIGDSVTLAAAGPLLEALPGVFVDAEVSRPLSDAPDIMVNLEKQGKLRDFVVIALATNSTARVAQVNAVIQAAGDRKVIFVTGHADRSWVKPTNALLEKASSSNSKVAIADWDKAISGHDDELARDGIHPSVKGATRYARVIVDALQAANLVKQDR